MAESKLVQLKFENSSYKVFSIVFSMLCKPWLHSDIRSCCRPSLHAFTSRYASTLPKIT